MWVMVESEKDRKARGSAAVCSWNWSMKIERCVALLCEVGRGDAFGRSGGLTD